MRKDIDFEPVTNVYVAICQHDEEWKTYIVNKNKETLENVMITSRGYGKVEGEEKQTSTLRHLVETLKYNEYALVEPIDKQVFGLTNEYWVSYFINGKVYDKKFIFLPDSILEKNTIYIEDLKMKGILHE